MSTTTNMSMTKPGLLDVADITVIDADLDILDVHDHSTNAKGLAVKRINSAVFASRPAFSIAGQIFFASDTSRLFLDTGAAWTEIVANNTSIPLTFTGGMAITGGTVAVGGTAAPGFGLVVEGNGLLTGGAVAQYGVVSNPICTNAATTSMVGVLGGGGTAAAAFTCNMAVSLFAQNMSKGAGSTITSQYGVWVDPISSGNTNNYGVYVNAPSGGSGQNTGAFINGGIVVVGAPTPVASSFGLSSTISSTVGAAGAASALPANPLGYWTVYAGTTAVKVPYYNT